MKSELQPSRCPLDNPVSSDDIVMHSNAKPSQSKSVRLAVSSRCGMQQAAEQDPENAEGQAHIKDGAPVEVFDQDAADASAR